MRFGVISAYPTKDWHSRRLIAACARRGEVEVFAPTAFCLRVGGRPAVLADGRDTRRIDVWLLPRALGRRGDPDFQLGVYRALAGLGRPLLNDVDALLAAEDKPQTSWRLARAGIPTPPARVVQSLPEAEAALAELGPSVVKPPYGSLGIGVETLRPGRDARRRLARVLTAHRLAYLQALVECSSSRGREDLRLFVVGARVAGAVRRQAAAGQFLTNAHQGATLDAFAPNARLERIAIRAARVLGLAYAGVDIIETDSGPTVLEVNGAPRWRGILETTGQDMADAIVALAAARAEGRDHATSHEGDPECRRRALPRRVE